MSAEPLWRDQLEAHIRTEGGRWNSDRMQEACRTAGHPVTVQRARLIFQHLAEANPNLLVKVDGARWSYDTVSPTA